MTRGEALKRLIGEGNDGIDLRVVINNGAAAFDARIALKIWETLNEDFTEVKRQDPETEKPKTMIKTKTPEAEEPAKKARRKLDGGKMKALRAAGWTYYEIADEMGCSPQTVHNYLNPKKTEG